MIKAKVKELATGKILTLFVIDAKESVATGRYVYVGEIPIGKAATPEAHGLDPDGSGEEEEGLEEDEDSTPPVDYKAIKTMNTEELTSLIAEKELDIEGFSDLNLKEKRAAVLEALGG